MVPSPSVSWTWRRWVGDSDLCRRQVIRRDAAGRRRYLDAEWQLPTGEIVVFEVDGSHHLDAANWQADTKRERSVVVSRRWALRATTFEVRLEPAAIARDLRALGVPSLGVRGWWRGRSGRVSSRRYARWGRGA
jgi:hypothetical protein